MSIQEWGIAVGVMISAVVAMAPWMLMVHAKLAVVATQIAALERKVDRLIEAHEQRLPMCATHAARLETLEMLLDQFQERLKELE